MLVPFEEVSYYEYAGEFGPPEEVFNCEDSGKLGPPGDFHYADAKELGAQEDASHYENAEELESPEEALDAEDAEELVPPAETSNGEGAGNLGSLEDASNGGDAEQLSSDASAPNTFSDNRVKDAAEPGTPDLDDSGTPSGDGGEEDEGLEAGAKDISSAPHVPPDLQCELCADWDSPRATRSFCGCPQGRFHKKCLARRGSGSRNWHRSASTARTVPSTGFAIQNRQLPSTRPCATAGLANGTSTSVSPET